MFESKWKNHEQSANSFVLLIQIELFNFPNMFTFRINTTYILSLRDQTIPGIVDMVNGSTNIHIKCMWDWLDHGIHELKFAL